MINVRTLQRLKSEFVTSRDLLDFLEDTCVDIVGVVIDSGALSADDPKYPRKAQALYELALACSNRKLLSSDMDVAEDNWLNAIAREVPT